MAETETDIETARPRRRGPSDEEIEAVVPRDRGRRELRVGAFVLAGGLAVVAALFLLTDPATLRGRYMLVTQVADAGGIRGGDPVQMRGVNIGRVDGFEMTRDGEVNIRLEIEGEWEVPEDSYTRLAGAGLFGGRTMQVIRGTSQTILEPWDTLASTGEEGGLLESAESLSSRAEDVLSRIGATLDDPTIGAMKGTATELQALVGELRAIASVQRSQLADLTASLNRAAGGFEEAAEGGPAVARAAARADTALLALNRTSATLDEVATSLGTVLGRIERGEGTLGRLTADDSLYVALNQAAQSIHLLAEDIRLNPDRYVRITVF